MVAGHKGPGAIFFAFPGLLVGSWIKSGAARTQTDTIMHPNTASKGSTYNATASTPF